MVCGDCVQKLASKLIENHSKLDLIRAFELAEKAIERVETRDGIHRKAAILEGIAGKDDYQLDCVGSTHPDYCGSQTCMVVVKPISRCTSASACSGTCDCPDPLGNSHQVTDGCVCSECCHNYGVALCPDGCGCRCNGLCGYDCDDGYTWNGSACIEVAVGQPYISRVQRVAGMTTWGGLH